MYAVWCEKTAAYVGAELIVVRNGDRGILRTGNARGGRDGALIEMIIVQSLNAYQRDI